jgi:hypothetical protein
VVWLRGWALGSWGKWDEHGLGFLRWDWSKKSHPNPPPNQALPILRVGMASTSDSKVRQYSVLFTGSVECDFGETLAEKIMHGCSAMKEIRILPIVEENRLSMNETSTGVRMFLTSNDSIKLEEWKRILESTCDSNQYQDPNYNHSNQSGKTNKRKLWKQQPYKSHMSSMKCVDRKTLGSPSSTTFSYQVRTDAAFPYLP